MATKIEKQMLYRRWKDMIRRCNDQRRPEYKNYGGRGIKVCDRWIESLDNFISDMGIPPKKHSLDRIDYNGNYEPENCRWATSKVQNNNTSRNRYITIDGKVKTLSQWIEYYDLKPSTIKQRYYSYGWDIKKALEIGG